MSPPFRKSFDEFDQPDENAKIPESPKTHETVEAVDSATNNELSTDQGIITQTDAELNENGEQDENVKSRSDDNGPEIIIASKKHSKRIRPRASSVSIDSYDSITSSDEVIEFDSDSDGNLKRYNRQFYNPDKFGIQNLKQRIRRGPKQVEHVAQYTKLIQDRLVTLENAVRRLKLKQRESPDSDRASPSPARDVKKASSSKNKRHRKVHSTDDSGDNRADDKTEDDDTEDDKWLKVKRLSLKDFHRPEYSLNHVIDVAMGTENQLRPKMTYFKHFRGDYAEQVAPSWSPENITSGMPKEIPIRLRINEEILVTELKIVCDENIRVNTTMLRPFKVLFKHEDRIRQHMAELEEKFKQLSNTHGIQQAENKKGTRKRRTRKSAKRPIRLPRDVSSDDTEDEQVQALSEGSESEFDDNNPNLVRRLIKAWRCLIEVLDVDLKDIKNSRDDLAVAKKSTIAFSDVWQLYEPGNLVFTREKGKLRAMRVLDVTGGRSIITATQLRTPKPPQMPPPAPPGTVYLEPTERDVMQELQLTPPLNDLYLTCYYIAFNGKNFGVKQVEFRIAAFDGEIDLTSLDVIPEQYLKDLDERKQELKERGMKVRDLLSQDPVAHRHYSGLTWNSPQEEIDGAVIVDWASALLHKHEWEETLGIKPRHKPDTREIREDNFVECNRRRGPNGYECPTCAKIVIFRDTYNDHIFERTLATDVINNHPILRKESIKGDEIQEEDLILIDFIVCGWILRDRRWAKFDVDLIKEIPAKKDGFKSLSLPEGYQEIVESLVTTHFKKQKEEKTEQLNVDLVQGKGKGLIILLHGAPGVGKTSTAECVAEYTGRPLYPITCGDIGETAKEVEQNLQATFQLAHKWGCVLLLDEADVFLAKRDKTDVKRNALVSVFLRVLEYYAGILFLTTNRVGTMDEAFRSRIHMSLHYPPLSEKFTREVWKTNLRRMRDGPPAVREMEYNKDEILKFAKKHFEKSEEKWNGRQIRNAFQTAIALAFWDRAKENNAESGSGESVKQKPAVLTRRHFEKVAETSRAFNEYMHDVNARTANEQAQVDAWRADSEGKFESHNHKKKSKKHESSSGSEEESDSRSKKYASKRKSDDKWDSSSDSDRVPKKGKSRTKNKSDEDDSDRENKKKSKSKKKVDIYEEDSAIERKGKKAKSKKDDTDEEKKQRKAKSARFKKDDTDEDS